MITSSNSDIQKNIKSIFNKYLGESRSEDKITGMMSEIFEYAESEVKKFVSDEERSHMQCKAGCSICCRVNVSVLYPEAVAIKSYLLQNRSAKELDKLKSEMENLVRKIKYLDEDERIFLNADCAFLDGKGACSIYPVRPLMCRSVTSADSEACKTAMSMMALDESVFVPMNIRQKSIMDSVFKSLAEEMRLAGIENRSREVTDQTLKVFEMQLNIQM